MAFTTSKQKKLNAVRLISRNDSAIDLEASDFTLYDQDPVTNEDAIKLLPGKLPTFFLCNFEFSGKDAAKIQDAMVGGVDEDKNIKMSMGNWAYEVTRKSLKDIQNPAGETDVLVLKKDTKGWVSEETMTELTKYGITQEIFNHYFGLTQGDVRANSKN